MRSQQLYRRVKLNQLRLSEQSPVACSLKLSFFVPDKDDCLWSGFQELFDGLSLLAQPALVLVLKISIISGKTENQLLLDSGEFASVNGCAGVEELTGFGFEFLPYPSALI